MAKDKKMISLEISDDMREELRLEAFKRKITISALIRQLLEESLKTINCEKNINCENK